jgi:hypothetical protein
MDRALSDPHDPLKIITDALRRAQDELRRQRDDSCIEPRPAYSPVPLVSLPARRRLKPKWVVVVLLVVVIGLARIFFVGSPLFPPSEWPAGTTAQCRDRSFSRSDTRSGTCSWHGGVAFWRYETDGATP